MYLFDIDGTLLLSGGAGTRTINKLFERRFGLPNAMEQVSAAGKTDPAIFHECARNLLGRELEEEELDSLLGEYAPDLADELQESEGFHLMPNVRETLEFLEGEVRHLGIATGNIRATALAKLDRANLRQHFAFGGYGCDSSDRAILVASAMQRGQALCDGPVRSADFVVIGDTLHDIAAAHECGARVVAVATGSISYDELAAHGPDAVLHTLAELPQWHQNHFRRAV